MNVLFDLDGTLTDPRLGIFACIRHALATLDCASPADDELARYIGPPLHQSFGTLLGTSDPQRVATAMALYRDRFSTGGLFENEVYAGIPATLAALADANATLFVATAKPHVYAERILEHFGLRQYFTAVYGSELDGTRTDKGELIAHLMVTESLAPESTYMVGDRLHDVAGAIANSVHPIGALWGFGSRDELLGAGAQWLCETPEAVTSVLSRL